MSTFDHLPKKQKLSLIQAKVDSNLQKKIRDILLKEEWTWNEVISAMMKQFISDYENSKRRNI